VKIHNLTEAHASVSNTIKQWRIKSGAASPLFAAAELEAYFKLPDSYEPDLVEESCDTAEIHLSNAMARSIQQRTLEYFIGDLTPDDCFKLPYGATEIISITDSEDNPVQHSTRGLSDLEIQIQGFYTDVTIEYRSGYTTAADIPPPIKTAVKKLALELYDNRGASNQIDISQVAGPTWMAIGKLIYPYRRNLI